MMALEIIDVSRREVKRWVDAGTLVCRFGDALRRNLDDDYMLVGMSITYNPYQRVICPFVAASYDDIDDMMCAARITEPEEVDTICGWDYCFCWEIWHLVDDNMPLFVEDDLDDLEHTDFEVSCRRLYEFAEHVVDMFGVDLIGRNQIVRSAWEFIDWYIDYFCSPFDVACAYPRKDAYILESYHELCRLGLESGIRHAGSSITDEMIYGESSYVEDIPF